MLLRMQRNERFKLGYNIKANTSLINNNIYENVNRSVIPLMMNQHYIKIDARNNITIQTNKARIPIQ